MLEGIFMSRLAPLSLCAMRRLLDCNAGAPEKKCYLFTEMPHPHHLVGDFSYSWRFNPFQLGFLNV